ncbi:MAG: fimbrillin family protein [Bacteroidales bacterium]|nr:fimbrillin family protein [Bacteroidales bacterium]
MKKRASVTVFTRVKAWGLIAAGLLSVGLLSTGCTKALEDAFNISKVEFVVRKVVDSGVPDNVNSYGNEFSAGIFVHEAGTATVKEIWGIPVVQNMFFRNSGGILDGDKLYFDKQKEYNVYSYAPFIGDNKINGESIAFEHETDVIWATAKYSNRTQGSVINKIQLDYEHLTSKVKFLFEDSRDPSLKELHDFSRKNFSISGFCKKFYLNVYTGKLTRGPIDPSVIITKENNPVCFAPKTGEAEYNLEIEIPATFPLNLPPVIIREKFNYNFRPGYSYEITINVMTADMSVNSHIVSWEYKVVEDLEIETK